MIKLFYRPALCLFLLFLILSLFYGRIVIQNDGLTYYALTVSLVEDRDFDLSNQYEKFPEIRVFRRPDGRIASVYSSGFAWIYSPFLYFANKLASWFPAISQWHPYAQNFRIPFHHSLALFTGSFFYGYFTVLLGSLLLIRHYGFSPGRAVICSLLVFAGTSLMFYTFTIPSFAHAADAFLVTAVVYLFLTPFRFRNMLLGFLLALSVLLRNNNAVLILPVVGVLLYQERKAGRGAVARTGLEIFLGALPVLITQLHYNYGQYGRFLATGYNIPITSGTIGDRFQSGARFYAILIHPVAGVYVWAPITALASIGLLIGTYRGRTAAIAAILMVWIVIISIRFLGMIWAGGSFAQRFLTHLFVFWLIGLAEMVNRRPAGVLTIASVCFLWTFFLFNLYYIHSGSSTGRKLLNRNDSRYTPVEMIQTAGLLENNPFSLWYRSLQSRPYPSLLFLKETPPGKFSGEQGVSFFQNTHGFGRATVPGEL